MRNVRLGAGLALALFPLLFAAAAVAGDDAGIKYRVIVGSFENKADHHWYHGPDPGEGMADMLITALIKSGKFRVFERAALDEILAEKNLSMSDLASPGVEAAKKVEIGDILVKGVITEFGYKEGKIGGSIAKLGGRGGLKSYTGRVAVDLRLISVGTSEVLWADSVDKSESSKSLDLSTSKFSFGDQKSFDEHVVGKATRKVINAVVDKLEEQTKKLPWSGILVVADEFLFIDAGSEIGLAPGMEFEVKRLDKEVKHPRTGKVLKRIFKDVGVVRATEVEEGVTTCEAVSGSGFATNDVITLKKK
jgi:curli biogenesis system outer membrane secretion channel CsgG